MWDGVRLYLGECAVVDTVVASVFAADVVATVVATANAATNVVDVIGMHRQFGGLLKREGGSGRAI